MATNKIEQWAKGTRSFTNMAGIPFLEQLMAP